MKIYTRTGDSGQTGLPGGTRVQKDADLLEACGTLDELNAWLGIARANSLPRDVERMLESVQHQLLAVGAELADVDGASTGYRCIDPEQISAMESAIDRHQAILPLLESFLIPGGTRSSAALHAARTVCRRGERRVVRLQHGGHRPIRPVLLKFLNRLSDMLFVFARVADAEAGIGDKIWAKNGPRFAQPGPKSRGVR
jgi:cob(I)alamin adenosyltransferase